MKKIDKLVFGSFIGPFLLTLIVVDFILLLVTLLKYFDQIMGKGLSFGVFAKLITYFSISASPDAFPLAVLLSSIMTFGNLGEHSELTAIKSSGISLVRSLVPIFVFVLGLTAFTYYSNTELVPKTNLKTYSLLWDMRTKKPALDIKQGVFYDGIPGYSIKVNHKVDDERLQDIIIYDHTNAKKKGNKEVILADSGRMYSFMNQRYLALELYNGIKYDENTNDTYTQKKSGGQFVRNKFSKSKIIFDLSSFDMSETDPNLFSRSRLVQTRQDLEAGIDSMELNILNSKRMVFEEASSTFRFNSAKDVELPEGMESKRAYMDSIRLERRRLQASNKEVDQDDSLVQKGPALPPSAGGPAFNEDGDPEILQETRKRSDIPMGELNKKKTEEKSPAISDEEALVKFDEYFENKVRMSSALANASNAARMFTNRLKARITTLHSVERDQRKFRVTRQQQVSRSFACLIMFLIGAPIGAIIKKGGLGMPVIVSVIFFLIFYTLNTTGDKWGKEGVVEPFVAMWMSNFILFPFGLFFLRQARNDARLFEADFYANWIEKIKKLIKSRKQLKTT